VDNLPTKIGRVGVGIAQFSYDPLGRLYREPTATTYFAGDGYERIGSGASATHRHELGPVIVITKASGTDPKHIYYALRDRLGSTIDVVDDRDPSNIQYRDYDAFGHVRDAQSLAWLTWLNLDPVTVHGFTDQEHADTVRLIHMGGRVYDYTLGRFLSVDPIVSNPLNSQSLNAYSYIGNNPLSGIDPTGYQSCTGSNVDRGAGTDCRDQGVSTTLVNPSGGQSLNALSDKITGIGASHWNQRVDAMTAKGSLSTPTSGSPADIGATGRTVGAQPGGRSDGAIGLDMMVVTPTGYHMVDYAAAYEFSLYPDWLRDHRALEEQVNANGMIVGFYDYQWKLFKSQFEGDAPTGGLAGGAGVLRTGQLAESAAAIRAIETPYGFAEQSTAAAAIAAREEVQAGAMLYRIGTTGKSGAAEAQFWALEHPSTPGFAARYGIPEGNVTNANFIEAARLRSGSSFITRQAPGYGGHTGGGIEVVVPGGGVEMQWFSFGGPQ
jgi:RHS repeat-associated protein